MTSAPDETPAGLRELLTLLGREQPLYAVHGALQRAARGVRPLVESGAVMAACSDEFNGEIRAAFERDVARLLVAPKVPATRRVFAVANLGGRIEPGAIALADRHFTALSGDGGGEKLLVIEIAAHVGRRQVGHDVVWGELDRFGTVSPCCGALRLLLDTPRGADVVRFPWFDQLTAFFGPRRLATLRADAGPHQMLRAAIVHAVLQAETAIVDLLRQPPPSTTHVLLLALVVVNKKGTDSALPVGVHLLRFAGGQPHLVHGESLRSTPDALVIETAHGKVHVTSPFPAGGEVPAPASPPVDGEAGAPSLAGSRAAGHGEPRPAGEAAATRPHGRVPASGRLRTPSPPPPAEEVSAHFESGRRQLAALRGRPGALRVYARPLLRAFVQGLSVLAPEVGLAALAVKGSRDLAHASRLRKLHERGPSSEEARAVLHDIEPMLQQLGHAEAHEVLELLLAEHPAN